MSWNLTRRIWTGPPNQNVILDLSNSIASLATFVAIPGPAFPDNVNRLKPVDTGTVKRIGQARGALCTKYAASAKTAYSSNLKPITDNNGNYTLAIYAAPIAATPADFPRPLFIGDESASPFAQIALGFNTKWNGSAMAVSSGSVGGFTFNSTYNSAASADSVIDGNFHLFVCVSTALGAPKLYVDGIDKTNASKIDTGSFYANAGGIVVGNTNDGANNRGCPDPISLAVVFNSRLTPGQVAQWGRNPWQIFKPRLRYIWKAPTAAAGAPVLQPWWFQGDQGSLIAQ